MLQQLAHVFIFQKLPFPHACSLVVSTDVMHTILIPDSWDWAVVLTRKVVFLLQIFT